ncbi:MAG: hypothetical protein RLY16_183 [Bacteroidota bacterium]|jgi:uncharacterized lipoprotein NlpE involved in copper resistance
MKKISTFVTALALFFSASAFTPKTDEPVVNPIVQQAFQKEFTGAKQVSWEKKEDLYFARFLNNQIKTEVAYNENGDLIATSQTIQSSQLPLAASMAFKSKFEGYTAATTATEVNYEKETHYYLTASNEKQIVKLKISASGEITVESKKRI